MIIHLKRQNEEFWPSKYGYKERNYTLKLDKNELLRIKDEAFIKSLLPQRVVNLILSKTLASGVCSGISGYTLYNFYGDVISADDPKFLIAIFQARTWGRYFIRQALYSYLSPVEWVLKAILKGIGENTPIKALIVFLPRILNLKNFTLAHTVVPFQWREGLQNIYIRIYDSNYPGDDTRVLVYNKISGSWQYDDKNNKEWVLTVNYLENLSHKPSFLL